MISTRITRAVTLLAAWAGIAASASAQQMGPDTPVPSDPAVTTGVLENGLTYYIRENTRPENRAELWLVVNVGSVLEEEDQIGLAHLLEHMAFNGTANFEKQELVDYLESIGMQFGPSVNAYTSFDETVYQLVVPTDDPEIVGTAFQILEDWAHDLAFDPEEIDKERGVVVEEWRLGLGAGARMQDKQIPILFRDSRYATRLPIGNPESIRTFEHESLIRFYENWYRPELMAVVAVGDFEAADIEALVRNHFGDLTSPDNPRPREFYGVPEHEETLFAVATDPEATTTVVRVTYKQPVREETTIEHYRLGLMQDLVDAMLNARLFELTQVPDAPFLAGFSGQGDFVRTSEVYQLFAAVPDGGIEAGLEALLIEAERMARFGFTQSELDRQKTELLRGLEQAFAERENRNSRVYAAEYQRAYLTGEPFPGIEWENQVARFLMQTITLDDVNTLARSNISDENRVIMVSAPEKEDAPVPSEEAMLAVFDRAAAAEIAAYEDEVADVPLMAEVPVPGTIVSRSTIEEIGVTVLELSNGAEVLLKPTDFKDDEIVFRAISAGGSSLASDEIYPSASLASTLVSQGGVGELSVVDLQKVLAGKAAQVGPNIGTLSEGLSGAASPKDVETLFQLAHLQFTDPRKDETVFQAWLQQVRPVLANRGAAPASHFQDTVSAVFTGNHPRRQPPTPEFLDELDLDVAFDFYEDRFADAGDFTFVLVGAFENAEIEPLIETYLASLPSTGREESWLDEGIHGPESSVTKIVKKGLEPSSQTLLTFFGDFEYTSENRVAIRALASALELRLRERLREDLGGTYSVGANGGYARFPRPEYTFRIQFGADPERLNELLAVVFEEVERMKTEGPSGEDLIKVREQDRRARETNLESNGWWAGQLTTSEFEDLDPRRLTRTDLFDSVTVDSVRAAARAWLDMDRLVRVSLVPENSTIF